MTPKGKHIEDYLKSNPAIPAKVLAWRETLPKGSIMSPSTFVDIAKAAKKKGYKDPTAVAGKAYWTTLMAKYRKAHRKGRTKKNPPIKVPIKAILSVESGSPHMAPEYRKATFIHFSSSYRSKGYRGGQNLIPYVKSIFEKKHPGHYLEDVWWTGPGNIYIASLLPYDIELHKKNFDPTSFATLTGASAIGTMLGKKLLGNPLVTSKYSLSKLFAKLKNGSARITTLVTGGDRWPDEPHYYSIDDLGNQKTYHVRVSDRPSWMKYYKKNNPLHSAVLKKSRSKKLQGNPTRRSQLSTLERSILGILTRPGRPGTHDEVIRTAKGWGYNQNEIERALGYIVQLLEFKEKTESKLKKIGKNPPHSAVKIYDRIYAIEAQKGKDSNFPKENFRHDFRATDSEILGMPDGSLVVKSRSGKRLWKNFSYPEKGR